MVSTETFFVFRRHLHVVQFRATKPESPVSRLRHAKRDGPSLLNPRFATARAVCSSFSSAIFCASITSPMGRFPSGPKHHAAERAPASSSSSIFIWRARRMR